MKKSPRNEGIFYSSGGSFFFAPAKKKQARTNATMQTAIAGAAATMADARPTTAITIRNPTITLPAKLT